MSYFRTFRISAWLGWQIESNWADPFLFAIYSLVKPLASVAILVVMYSVITGGDFESPMFTYMYIGNAFYLFVGQVMTGISWAVIDDREHYQTIKYIYIAPVHFPPYLIGRGAARFLTGSVSVVITLVAGVLFLNLQLDPRAINWPMFFAALAAGLAMLAAMGLLLGGITMQIANVIYFVGDAVAGGLYLFSGAIFPLEVMPAWLRPVGFVMPLSYWLEPLRRSLLGGVGGGVPTVARFRH